VPTFTTAKNGAMKLGKVDNHKIQPGDSTYTAVKDSVPNPVVKPIPNLLPQKLNGFGGIKDGHDLTSRYLLNDEKQPLSPLPRSSADQKFPFSKPWSIPMTQQKALEEVKLEPKKVKTPEEIAAEKPI
jgi:hypothetical protein